MNKNIFLFLFVIFLLSSCTSVNREKQILGVPRTIPQNPVTSQTQQRDGRQEDEFYFPNGERLGLQEALSILPWTSDFFSLSDIGGFSVDWIELRQGGKKFGWWGTATHYSSDIVIAYRYPSFEAFVADETELDRMWQELRVGGISKLLSSFPEIVNKIIEEQKMFLRRVEADGSDLTTSRELCGQIVYVRDYHPERVIINTEKIDDGSAVTGSTVITSTWSDHAEIIWVDSFGGTYNILDITPEKGEGAINLLLDVTSLIMHANGLPCDY